MIEPRQKVVVKQIVRWYEDTEECLLTVETLDYGGALHIAHHVVSALDGKQGSQHQWPTLPPLFYDLFAGIKFDKMVADLFALVNATPGDGRCSLKRRPPEWSLSAILEHFHRPLLICRAPASLPVIFWDRLRVELEKARSEGGFRLILITAETVGSLCKRLPHWRIVVGETLQLLQMEWIDVFEILPLACPGSERAFVPPGEKPSVTNVSDEAANLLLAIAAAAGGDRAQICAFAASLADNKIGFSLECIKEHLQGWRIAKSWDPIEQKWQTQS